MSCPSSDRLIYAIYSRVARFLYSYFKDGLKTIAHFGTYINDLSAKLNNIKQKQDEERRKLVELRTLLRSAPDFDRVEVS